MYDKTNIENRARRSIRGPPYGTVSGTDDYQGCCPLCHKYQIR